MSEFDKRTIIAGVLAVTGAVALNGMIEFLEAKDPENISSEEFELFQQMLAQHPEIRSVYPAWLHSRIANDITGIAEVTIPGVQGQMLAEWKLFNEDPEKFAYIDSAQVVFQAVDPPTFGDREPGFYEGANRGMGFTDREIRHLGTLDALRTAQADFANPRDMSVIGEDGRLRVASLVKIDQIDEALYRHIVNKYIVLGYDLTTVETQNMMQEEFSEWFYGIFGIEAPLIGPEFWNHGLPMKTCPAYLIDAQSRPGQQEFLFRTTFNDTIEVLNDGLEQEDIYKQDSRGWARVLSVVDPETGEEWYEIQFATNHADPLSGEGTSDEAGVPVSWHRPFPCGPNMTSPEVEGALDRGAETSTENIPETAVATPDNASGDSNGTGTGGEDNEENNSSDEEENKKGDNPHKDGKKDRPEDGLAEGEDETLPDQP